MCMGALLMKKAGVNPMWAVSPAMAMMGAGKKKKSKDPYQPPVGG